MQDKQERRPGPATIRAIAEHAVELLCEELLRRAAEKGGGLTAPDIRAAAAAFRQRPTPALTDASRAAWEECLRAAESAHWAKARKFHLERMLVKGFSGLLPPSDETLQSGRHLSRRIIPGFIHALQQMLGQELYEQHGERAKTLVDTLRAVHGEAFSWGEVYADPTCEMVVEDVLVAIAPHFADMAKRRNWMIDIVESQMPPASNDAERQWRFDDGAFHALINALYGPLRAQLQGPGERDGLAARHGENAAAALEALFDGLTRDHADLEAARRI